MLRSILTCTGAMNLAPLNWNSFSQASTTSYVNLAASFTPSALTVLMNAGSAGYAYGEFTYRWFVAATVPGWIKVGTGVKIAASITLTGSGTGASPVSQNLSDNFIVSNVDPSGTYFDTVATRSTGGKDGVALTATLVKTNLDSGSGVVTAPLVTMVIQAQTAVFAVSASASLAVAVDVNGVAQYTIALTSGTEYTVTAPMGAKFDLEDFYFKAGSASTLSVRFL